MEWNNLLRTDSLHASSVKRGISNGQFLRARHISYKIEDDAIASESLIKKMVEKGFDEHVLRQISWKIPLYILFLNIYIFTLLGNWIIILMIYLNPVLHTPMYFFIGNLGCLDIIYISTTMPKMLHNFFQERKSISYAGCVAQLYLYLVMAATESTLLSTMAYDRYVSICNPLCYYTVMNKKVCLQLTTTAWLVGMAYSLIHTVNTFRLNYCNSNKIDHFFCDIPPLMKISCSDTSLTEISKNVSLNFIPLKNAGSSDNSIRPKLVGKENV
ncbi:olfactory receptor 12D1-like [Hyperolius riggenbachi]|uniref:olfactory receptor 12D1-like n=1 Tax=Hyperolius riggenbachi TaxID=752182 RepID=UPI0035A32CB7